MGKFKKIFEKNLKDEFGNYYFVKQKISFRSEQSEKVIFSNFEMWETINPGYHQNDYKMKFIKKINPKNIKAKIPIKSENDMKKLQKLDVKFIYNNETYYLIGSASIIKSDKLPKNVGIWEL